MRSIGHTTASLFCWSHYCLSQHKFVSTLKQYLKCEFLIPPISASFLIDLARVTGETWYRPFTTLFWTPWLLVVGLSEEDSFPVCRPVFLLFSMYLSQPDLNILTMAAFTLEESNHSFAPFSANLDKKNHSRTGIKKLVVNHL
jgi:hypothetical protein